MADRPTDPWEPVDGLCNARKTRTEGLCRHEAGWRTDHPGIGSCRYHGGMTPTANAHAAKVRKARELEELLAEHYDDPDLDDPLKGVLDVVRSTGALRKVLAMRVSELFDRRIDEDGVQVDGDTLYGPNHLGDQAPHVLFGMLEKATSQHLQACKVALDQGVAESLIRIEQDRLDLMAQALQGLLAELGHSLDDPAVQEAMVRHLSLAPPPDDGDATAA